jgi:F-type H+-transporting ATPase subunit gamma
MSQIIRIAQRIKVIESVYKTTNAMRLVSMAIHTKLKHQKKILQNYKNYITELAHEVAKTASTPLQNQKTAPQAPIIIIISSQKGLCGGFNNALWHFFLKQQPAPTATFISIGKYAHDNLIHQGIKPVKSYFGITSEKIYSTAQELINYINTLNNPPVIIYSMKSESFFLQEPYITSLNQSVTAPALLEPEPKEHYYSYEQSKPDELREALQQLVQLTTLEYVLFESLLAEQAARFLSMDSSTRNAQDLLVAIKLEYNKSRQMLITQELTELASSMTK